VAELLCKICGLTRAEDVAFCHGMGADFIGFIFARRSPRFVEAGHAALLPVGSALRVGVFVGSDIAEVRDIARRARLDMIQLHGGEDVEFCRALGAERVIKTIWPERLSPEKAAEEMERFAPVCAYFLLDAGGAGGGSGKLLDTAALRRLHPPKPWFLAGGLGTDTLPSVLSSFTPAWRPYALDMNSALESSPGVKDHDMVRKALGLAGAWRQDAVLR
jgi:phosphoribosylanthranilate isomerase